MEFIKESSVAVGAINPAIIVPRWVVQQGILPDDQVRTEHSLYPGTLSIRHSMHNLQWTVTNQNIVVEALDMETVKITPADFLLAVLTKLEHTPIRAIGNNFTFVSLSSYSTLEDFCYTGMPLTQLAPSIGAKINKASGVFEFLDERSVQVQATLSGTATESRREVFLNYHRDVSGIDDIKKALESAPEDLDRAKDIASKLWS